jgi:hypothetical protein
MLINMWLMWQHILISVCLLSVCASVLSCLMVCDFTHRPMCFLLLDLLYQISNLQHSKFRQFQTKLEYFNADVMKP